MFWGTSGDHGQFSPSISTPFGLISVGPHTEPRGHSGYNNQASELRGFSHTRIEGVGCSGTGGNVLLRPGYGAFTQTVTLNKNRESASTKAYTAYIDSSRIMVSLEASPATATHEYTFLSAEPAHLFLDLTTSFARFDSAHYTILSPTELQGRVHAKNVCNFGSYTLHFGIRLNKEVAFEELSPNRLVAYFTPREKEVLIAEVSISSISAEHLFEERVATSFDEALSPITIDASEKEKELFYTLFYRTLLSPFASSSPNGSYRGSDGKVYTSDHFTYYSGWSIWDTFRTKYPLLSITHPEVYADLMQSLVELYKQGKVDWATETESTPTVRTEHAVVLLLDAWRKGYQPEGLRDIFPLIVEETERYSYETPDKWLESAYDLWAVSELAYELGFDDTGDEFAKKWATYRSVWREHFKAMGEDSDIMHGRGLYEGTLWQYRWFTPHDMPWALDELGGAASYADTLDYFFSNYLYNHGNQPDIHAPFLFNQAGQPWKSQHWVRHLLTQPYHHYYGTHDKWEQPVIRNTYLPQPKMFIPEMDDDAGTMSAWYVLASMGLYPALVGEPIYTITTPLFKEQRIQVGEGFFQIKAINQSKEHNFIQSATLNGMPINRSWITYQEIMEGGVLELKLGTEPNTGWGTEPFPFH